MGFFNRTNQRRSRVRKEVAKQFADLSRLADPDVIYSSAVWLLFVLLSVAVLGYDPTGRMTYGRLAAIVTVVVLIGLAAAFHISQYQKRLIKNRVRTIGLVVLLISMLICAKLAVLLAGQVFWVTGTAVATALILTIAYNQRFAMAMSFVYCVLASLATGQVTDLSVLLTMLAGALPYCFLLKEIRTRMRLLEVSLVAAITVFIMSTAMRYLSSPELPGNLFADAGPNAAVTLLVGVLPPQAQTPRYSSCRRVDTRPAARSRKGFPNRDKYDPAGLQRRKPAPAETARYGSAGNL